MTGRPLAAALATALGAACGSSGPVVLASGEVAPATAIAVQGGEVYWLSAAQPTTPAALRAVSAKGGAARTVASVAAPRALAVSGSAAIIATSGGNVYQVPLAGGALEVLIPKNLGDAAIAVAAVGDFAYAAFASGRIARASISGGSNTVQELDSAADQISLLAADAGFVYWATGLGDIYRQPADGTGTGVLLGNVMGAAPVDGGLTGNGPTIAAPLGESFYLLGKSFVGSVAEGSGHVGLLLPDIGGWGLASNGSALYIGLKHGIARLNTSTGAAPIVVSLNVAGSSLAADGSSVYWLSGALDENGNPAVTSTVYRAGL